jgi:predicted cobalt transporter CbtA
MIRTLFLRGLVAGLIAGLAAGVFAFAFGEPLIDRAIAVEAASNPAGHAEEALVSRDGQRIGLFLATGIYGLALGGLFGLVFAVARGRIRARSDIRLSVGLAGALFAAVVLVPFLKYPAAPPGVGDPATITERTLLYLTVVATSLLALLAAWRAARSVPEPRLRPVTALAVFAATVTIVAYVAAWRRRGSGVVSLGPALGLPPDLARGAGDPLGVARPRLRHRDTACRARRADRLSALPVLCSAPCRP